LVVAMERSVDFLHQRHAFGEHRTTSPERPAVHVPTDNISVSSTPDLAPCCVPPYHRVDHLSVGPDKNAIIVQASHPRLRTYSGPIDAFSQILQHEGGLKGIYFHPHLFIPTVIDNTLRPLVSLALPGILAGFLGPRITEETHPVIWSLAELVGSCAGLLVTLPFETIRRRLQVQVRGTARAMKTCVDVRPLPYNGVVDTLWHVLTEERSDLPLPRRRKRTLKKDAKGKERAMLEEDGGTSWLKYTGIGQLYRGLGMRVGASVIVFLLALLSSGEGQDGGWAEL